tara:strand:- start:55 stop:315 length:261 start_codon:yes stop_codon:yes gene_type:complete
MLRIRLRRDGRRNLAMYSVVVAEQKFRRDGRFIEKIGYYQPILLDTDPYRINLNTEVYDKWVALGAQPSEKVQFLYKKMQIKNSNK